MIRILIADDQKTARETIKYILQKDPEIVVVGSADDGHEAIRLAGILNPDLILMDLEMPNLDGLAATRLISQKYSDIKIVILSFQDREELLTQALNAGARSYLFKGIVDSQEILNTIHLVYEENSLKIPTNKSPEIHGIQNNNGKRANNAIAEVADINGTFSKEPHIEKISEAAKFDFPALLSILKRRCLPALMGFLSVFIGAGLYLILAQRNYQATALISLEDRGKSISELGKNLTSVIDSNEYSPLASLSRLIKSKSVLNDALDKDFQEQDDVKKLIKNMDAAQIKQNLSVDVVPNTNILEISYVNADPELAYILLNEIIDAVIVTNTDTIRSEASSVRQFLEKEVSKQRQELSQIETAENRYREQEGIVAVDNQTANLVNSLNNLSTQEQDLSTQIKELESKVNNIKQIAKVNDAESAYIKAKIGQDPQLQKLRSQLTDIETELAAARSNFTDNNPTVIAIVERRDKIFDLYQKQLGSVLGTEAGSTPSEITADGFGQTENGLGQEVFSQLIINQTQLEANREKLQAVQIEKEKINNQIALLPDKVQSLTELVRQKAQADESLQFLQRKLEEARIAEAQLVSNIQVVEQPSMPSSPSSPNTSSVLAIATVVATVIMAGIILLLEKIDPTLYDGERAEQKLNIPFLAALPYLPYTDSNRIKAFLSNSSLYEPYRFLLRRLESQSQNPLKIIVVTSAISLEGKSEVASHLGIVSAALSKKTLIIDVHFLCPKQHITFQLESQPGLKDVVTSGRRIDRVIQQTENTNLSILTAGVPTSDSWMILESPKFKNILQQAATDYDLVIIDTPSVSSSCDAFSLSQYSSGLVIVTRPLHTPKDALEQTIIDLKKNKAPILGFVVNNAEKQKQKLPNNSAQSKPKPALLIGSTKKNSRRNTKEVS